METLLVVEKTTVLHQPQAKTSESRHNGTVEVLGVGGGWTITLLHNELTDPLHRALTHQQVWRADHQFSQTSQDFHGGQCTVQIRLPLGQ